MMSETKPLNGDRLIEEMDRLFPPNDGSDSDGNPHVRYEERLVLRDTAGSCLLEESRAGEFADHLHELDEEADDTYERFWDLLNQGGFAIPGTESW